MTISMRAKVTQHTARPEAQTVAGAPRLARATLKGASPRNPERAAVPLEEGRGKSPSVAARGDVRTSATLPQVAQTAATTAGLMLAGAVVGSWMKDKPGDFIPMGAIVGGVAVPVTFHALAPAIAKAATSASLAGIGRAAGEVALNGGLALVSSAAGVAVDQAVTGYRGPFAGLWGGLAGPLVFMSLKAAFGTCQATLISAAICCAAILPNAKRS